MVKQPKVGRVGILQSITNWGRLLALIALIGEASFLAVLAKSKTVDSYMLLFGAAPLILIIIGVFMIIGRGKKGSDQEHYYIAGKVEFLRDRLVNAQFQPDLIIGLSRGGLVVAARLSYELGRSPPTPTISLWPHAASFDNPLNSFDLRQIYSMQKDAVEFSKRRPWRVLIIDDACQSGRSLDFAKRHVEQKLSGLPAQIQTAALEIERGTHRTSIEPDFFASAGTKSMDAWGDYEEP
jgi:hypoxanthine phosphoribosyltransferase